MMKKKTISVRGKPTGKNREKLVYSLGQIADKRGGVLVITLIGAGLVSSNT